MPADASIYSLIRPQERVDLERPEDIQLKRMQLQQLMRQGQMGDLQMQQTRDGIDADRRIAALFSNGTPTEQQVSAINPKRGMEFGKSLVDRRKAEGDIGKTQAETLKMNIATARDALVPVGDQASYDAWREGVSKLLGPDFARTIPAQFSVETKTQNLMKAEDAIKRLSPELKMQDTGGGIVPVNPYTGAQQAGTQVIPKAATPGEVLTDTRTREEGKANRGVTMRGQNLTNDRALETAGRDQFGPLTEVTGPDGKPMLVIQNKKTGLPVDPNTRQPVGAVAPKSDATAQKQQTGVQNTKSAIAEYREALKGFGTTDILKPDARARMGTVYNNMMLQAKEAFNLGVLNGPDYMILQEVITNPASLKGGITSKEALDDQAKKLDEIMGRMGQQITATQTGRTPPAPTPRPAGKSGIKFLGFE